MASPCGTPGRHYLRGQQVTPTEDLTHEFKGHRSISVFDLPQPRSRDGAAPLPRTRTPVSASIGGMLNTGLGGTVYLGVSDVGRVVGLPLTQHQQDHVTASLSWTLERFTPPVARSRYRVVFVPVLPRLDNTSKDTPDRRQSSETGGGAEGEGSAAPHHVATPKKCWCDEEARKQAAVPQQWIVEIHLRPWDPRTHQGSTDPPAEDPATPPLPPLHLTEADVCYYRHGSRQVTLHLDLARRLLVHRTHRHYTLLLAGLRDHLEALRTRARERGLLEGEGGQEGDGETSEGQGEGKESESKEGQKEEK